MTLLRNVNICQPWPPIPCGYFSWVGLKEGKKIETTHKAENQVMFTVELSNFSGGSELRPQNVFGRWKKLLQYRAWRQHLTVLACRVSFLVNSGKIFATTKWRFHFQEASTLIDQSTLKLLSSLTRSHVTYTLVYFCTKHRCGYKQAMKSTCPRSQSMRK